MTNLETHVGGTYFDGDSPEGQAARMRVEGEQLRVELPDGVVLDWPAAEVRMLPDNAGKRGYMLRWTADPVARLFGVDAELLTDLPHLKRRAPPKGRGRLAAWATAAVAAVAVQIFVLIPLLANNLAGFIPPSGERALGEATLGQIRAALDETGNNPLQICEGAEGVTALNSLVARMSVDQDFQQAVTVSVLDHDMINAFALPGGYVVLFRGLIDAAGHPDEVAAVLAHEIGHVISRDPTRHALRSAGSIGVLGLLFGDFAGGTVVLFLANRLISAQYSQAAETGADSFAHEVLAQSHIRPGALGDMFETMRSKHGDRGGVAAHFLSHPSLGKRIDAARAIDVEGVNFRASMSPDEWKALQAICNK